MNYVEMIIIAFTVMMKTALISFLFAFEYVHTSILASAELRVSAVLGTSSWV